MELSSKERKVLRNGKVWGGSFTVLGNIKRMCDGDHKEVLKSLEDKGLIRMIAYGKFELTDKAYSSVVKSVGCVGCGKHFDNPREAMKDPALGCDHENLSISLKEFADERKR